MVGFGASVGAAVGLPVGVAMVSAVVLELPASVASVLALGCGIGGGRCVVFHCRTPKNANHLWLIPARSELCLEFNGCRRVESCVALLILRGVCKIVGWKAHPLRDD